jgi:parallel beta-helix repeat protein
LTSSGPEGALRVKPGLNSLSNALKKAKESGISDIFLEDGVHDEKGKDVVIDFPITIIGESKDGCTIIGGLRMKGKKKDDVNVKHLTISQSKGHGVFGDGGMSFHLFHLNIEKSEYSGVSVWSTKRNTMSNCQVSHSKKSGVYVGYAGLITMNGSGTSIHNNVTGGSSNRYGLHTYDSSASIHLVSPLTKESVSINNGGGGNYNSSGTIKTID